MNPSDLTETQTIAAPPELEIPVLDVGDVVEEAEQMLRESAPHDFDLLVIGGGPGGYTAAIRAAQLGAHVGLVEDRELGGVCLNRGCIPTKTLLGSVDVLRLIRRAREYGITVGEAQPDFASMNERKRAVVAQLRQGVEELLVQHNIELVSGRARFVGEHVVEVEKEGQTRRINAVHIVIATGSLPARLPVPGADLPGVITSDELLQSEVAPTNIVTIGAGAVGIEFAYLFQQLGARSTILEASPQILPQEDDDIAETMEGLLRDGGLNIVTGASLKRIEQADGELKVIYRQGKAEKSLRAQTVLMAAGRKPNTAELNLEEAGIAHDDGQIEVDENCETNVAGVYAIGDCVRAAGWAHLAAGEGTLVAERITRHAQTVDLRHVPSCYYTHPEIASVGLTLAQAEEKGINARCGKFAFRSNGKAAAAGDHDGWVKIVIDADTEMLLGCQIIGPRATELINQAVLALKTGQTVDEVVGSIHAHPTFGEALPEAAMAARGSIWSGESTPE